MTKQQLMKNILQGLLLFLIFHFVLGEDAPGKPPRLFTTCQPVAMQTFATENSQVLIAQPWHFMVFEKTEFGPKRLCFGIPILLTLILTTASCVNGRSTENLFVAYQQYSNEQSTKMVINYCKVTNVTEHPFFNSATKSHDAAILMINAFPIDWKKLQPGSLILDTRNEDVEIGTRAKLYVWASPYYGNNATMTVYDFGLELVNYEECKRSKFDLENVKAQLYARTEIPKMLGLQVKASRGTAVIQDSFVIGLITDYIQDPAGSTVCLVISDLKSIDIEDFAYWGDVSTTESGEHTKNHPIASIEPTSNKASKESSHVMKSKKKVTFAGDIQNNPSMAEKMTTGHPVKHDESIRQRKEKASHDIDSRADLAFQKNELGLPNVKPVVPRPWQFMVSISTQDGIAPLCFGTSIDNDHIVTTATCVYREPAEILFIAVERFDMILNKTKVVGYFNVEKVTQHPSFDYATKSFDTAILKIDKLSLNSTSIQSKLTPNMKKEKVKLGTKAKGYFWAKNDTEILQVHEFELELISHQEFKTITSRPKKIKTHLYAKTFFSKPEWTIEESQGSAVVLDNIILLGLILDYINDEDGNIVGLIIADARFMVKRQFFKNIEHFIWS